jgi:guanyl-specific ribonuclease Sa
MKQTAIDKMKELVFMAIGEASMCWEPTPSGIFKSTKAKDIGERLVRELQAQEKSAEQTIVDEGLREALEIIRSGGTIQNLPSEYKKLSREDMQKIADDCLSRHQAPASVESLAELADKKGCYIRTIRHYPDAGQWAFYIQEKDIWMSSHNYGVEYTGETYASAEQNAREYLNGLPDVKGGK